MRKDLHSLSDAVLKKMIRRIDWTLEKLRNEKLKESLRRSKLKIEGILEERKK